MTASEQLVNAAIAEQARAWFVANDEGSLDAQQTAAFLSWLRASPVHVRAFLGVSGIARNLKAAADDPEFGLDALLEQARADSVDPLVTAESAGFRGDRASARRPGTRYMWALAGVAAVLVLGLSLLWWSRDGERFGLPRTYDTGHGEQAVWRLPDGSMLHLNTDSNTTVHYSKTERVVDVNRGQALFEVARGDRRRFRVSAGEAQVLAVGTEFDVYRRRDATLVTVVEGTVTVCAGEPPPPSSGTALPGLSLRVSAGQQVGVEGGKLWSEPMPVDAKAAVAWLHRQIIVEDRPLGEVAEEFNRYGQVHVEIDDPALRALRVSGRFDAYDLDSLAAFLGSLDRVAIERTPTGIRVLTAAPPKDKSPPIGH
jgi:transmembrane sensor